LSVEGFPAMTEDGALVAAVTRDEGAIWSTRPYLVAIDPDTDRVIHKAMIVTERESAEILRLETSSPQSSAAANQTKTEVRAAVRGRLAELQAWLDARRWLHLAELEISPASKCSDKERGGIATPGRDPGAVVTLDLDGVHVVERAPGGSVLLDRRFPSWVVRPQDRCRYEPFVESAAVEPARGVLLLGVAQCEVAGGDGCEAPARIHVLRTKPATAAP
jgi:hypothetical protein